MGKENKPEWEKAVVIEIRLKLLLETLYRKYNPGKRMVSYFTVILNATKMAKRTVFSSRIRYSKNIHINSESLSQG